jgi:intraflagellar transport protein 172
MEFMECIMLTAHLLSIRGKCQNHFPDLATVAAKQSISLLRYADYVPMDQVYFDAGHFAKNSGMMNMAFVCFNRYLDIADAIEDGVGMLSDNADFAGTDVPFRVKLPKKNLPVSLLSKMVL